MRSGSCFSTAAILKFLPPSRSVWPTCAFSRMRNSSATTAESPSRACRKLIAGSSSAVAVVGILAGSTALSETSSGTGSGGTEAIEIGLRHPGRANPAAIFLLNRRNLALFLAVGS
jgi:hypothetical protein